MSKTSPARQNRVKKLILEFDRFSYKEDERAVTRGFITAFISMFIMVVFVGNSVYRVISFIECPRPHCHSTNRFDFVQHSHQSRFMTLAFRANNIIDVSSLMELRAVYNTEGFGGNVTYAEFES